MGAFGGEQAIAAKADARLFSYKFPHTGEHYKTRKEVGKGWAEWGCIKLISILNSNPVHSKLK